MQTAELIEHLTGIVKMQADIIQRQSEALEQAAEARRNVMGEL